MQRSRVDKIKLSWFCSRIYEAFVNSRDTNLWSKSLFVEVHIEVPTVRRPNHRVAWREREWVRERKRGALLRTLSFRLLIKKSEKLEHVGTFLIKQKCLSQKKEQNCRHSGWRVAKKWRRAGTICQKRIFFRTWHRLVIYSRKRLKVVNK